jgi:hypothetical protein
VLAGCGGDAPPTARGAGEVLTPPARDSAGIALRVHPAGALARAAVATLDSVPLAVITGSATDAASDISTMRSVAFLGDGRLVGIDPDRMVIKVFAPDGGSWDEFGRKGSGPGELGMVYEGHRTAGDTVVFTDISNGRAVWLDPASGTITTTPLVKAVGLGTRTAVGRFGDRLVLQGTFSLGDPTAGGPTERGVKVALLPTSGDDPTLIYRSAPEPPPVAPKMVGGMIAVRALSPATMFVPQGAAVVGDRLFLIDGRRWRLTEIDSTGTTLSVIGLDEPRVAVTDQLWQTNLDLTVQRLLANSSSDIDTAQLRRGVAEAERPDSLPAWQRMDVTPRGTIWLLRYPVPGESGWTAVALDPDGRLLGRLDVSEGDPPLLFGDNRALFRTEDELGIATLTIRRVRLPGS